MAVGAEGRAGAPHAGEDDGHPRGGTYETQAKTHCELPHACYKMVRSVDEESCPPRPTESESKHPQT
jgi:hypothetical protein